MGVYHSLPFSDLSLKDDPKNIEGLEELRNKYYAGSVLLRMRGEMLPKTKEKPSAIVRVYEKIKQGSTASKRRNQPRSVTRAQNKVQIKNVQFFTDLKIKEHPQ